MNCYELTIRLLRKLMYNHTKVEKEENMTSECDKRRLIGDRMVVKLRNGTKLMVFEERVGFLFVDISGNGFDHCHLFFWDKDLKWIGRSFNFVDDPEQNPDYDIVKIYKPIKRYTIEDRLYFNDECDPDPIEDGIFTTAPLTTDYKWCWERSETEPKEMTVAEIEKELGYPVKIVKKHKCNYFQSQEQLVDIGDPILFDKGCPGR